MLESPPCRAGPPSRGVAGRRVVAFAQVPASRANKHCANTNIGRTQEGKGVPNQTGGRSGRPIPSRRCCGFEGTRPENDRGGFRDRSTSVRLPTRPRGNPRLPRAGRFSTLSGSARLQMGCPSSISRAGLLERGAMPSRPHHPAVCGRGRSFHAPPGRLLCAMRHCKIRFASQHCAWVAAARSADGAME